MLMGGCWLFCPVFEGEMYSIEGERAHVSFGNVYINFIIKNIL